MAKVWLNGNLIDEPSAGVPLRDAGLLHGAGVFTTMRSHDGRVFALDRHLARLRASCEALFIPLQYRDVELETAVADLHDHNQLDDARMRLTVTRGAVSQDPLHGTRIEPTVFLTAAPLEPYPAEFYERGLTVILLDEQKLNPYDIQAGHKTLDYFSRLFALREANRRGSGEALWFNVHNFLQSGSTSNVFMVENNTLITPPSAQDLRDAGVARTTPYSRSNVLPGITRGIIIEAARAAGIEVRTQAIDVNRLLDAHELFLTNSIMGVMPVCRIERKSVGNEKPGPLTMRLSDALRAQISQEPRRNESR